MKHLESYCITQYGQPLMLSQIKTPQPKGNDVLLEILGCGVCHSDLHILDGHFSLGMGKKIDLSKSHKLPLTLGHEIVGKIVECGEKTTEISIGDIVVVYPWIGCGKCDLCSSGNEHLCDTPQNLGVNVNGGFSTHIIVPHTKYLFPITNVDLNLAATYACSGLTAFSAMKKIKAKANGKHLLIIGAGGVGLAAVKIAKVIMETKIIVADIEPSKRDAALQAGADFVIDPSEANSRQQITDLSSGGAIAAADFVGSDITVKFGTQCLRKLGCLVVVGLFGGSVGLSVPMFPLKSISVVGSFVGSLSEMGELMNIVNSGAIGAIPVSTRPLAEVNECLEDLAKGNVIGRTVLNP